MQMLSGAYRGVHSLHVEVDVSLCALTQAQIAIFGLQYDSQDGPSDLAMMERAEHIPPRLPTLYRPSACRVRVLTVH